MPLDPISPHSDDLREYFFSAEPEIVALDTIELRHPLLIANTCLYSQDFSNGVWHRNAATLGTTTNIAPDGTSTATKLLETATTAQHYQYQDIEMLGPGLDATVSIQAKPNGRDWIILLFRDDLGGDSYIWFNVTTGAVGASKTGSVVDPFIVAAANGFYRVGFTTYVAGPGTKTLIVYAATADGVSNYAGDITKGLIVWGAQVEYGNSASAYAVTAGAAALAGVRFVNDPSDLTATLEDDAPLNAGESVTFNKGRFLFVPPESSSPGLPTCDIECMNVGGDLQSKIELALSYPAPLLVTYRQFLSDDLTAPAFVLNGLNVKTARAGVFRVVATAGFEDLLNKPFPRRLYTTREFPGLVR